MTWFNPNLSEHTPDPFEEAKDITSPKICPTDNLERFKNENNAQQSMHLTSYGRTVWAFCAGFVFGLLACLACLVVIGGR